MLFTIYDRATGAVVRSGDLPDSEINKIVFPKGAIIKYGVALAQPVAVSKVAEVATDPSTMAKRLADLVARVEALEAAQKN